MGQNSGQDLALGKKLAFSIVAILLSFLVLEGLLFAVGISTAIDREDPFRGFSGLVSVYEKRGGSFRTRAVNTNTFNDESFSVRKPANGFRIFGLGGSSAFGFPWGAEAAFTRIVGEVLSDAHPSRAVEAVNASGTSYAMHRLNRVADELLAYEPDLFVVFSGHNEFVEPSYFETLKRRSPFRNRLEYVLSHTRVYSAIRLGLGMGRSGARDLPRFGIDVRRDESRVYSIEEKAEIVEEFRQGLERLVVRARSAGVRVILLTVPANLSRWRPESSTSVSETSESSSRRWSERFLAGRRSLAAGDPRRAVTLLIEAARELPGHAETQFLLGTALENMGRFEEAARAFDAAADADASPIRRTSGINQAIRQVASAQRVPLVDADQIFRAQSPNGLVGFDLIEDYVHPTREGHELIAWHVVQEIESAGWLGAPAPVDRNRFDQILARRNAKPRKPNATWFYNTGVVLSDQGRYAEAIEKYREALEIQPDYPAAMMNLGLLLVETGQDDEAIEPLRRLIELDRQSVGAYLNLGNALQNLGRFEEAVTSYRQAIEIQPEIAFAHNNMANALQSLGRYADAEVHYRRALELRPDYANAHANWGNSLGRQGRFQDAVAHYREALRLQPDHPGAQKMLRLAVDQLEGRAEVVR